MKWRAWRHREELAQAKAQEAAEQLARIRAQRPVVEHVAKAVTRETVEINGWTQRAKRAFS